MYHGTIFLNCYTQSFFKYSPYCYSLWLGIRTTFSPPIILKAEIQECLILKWNAFLEVSSFHTIMTTASNPNECQVFKLTPRLQILIFDILSSHSAYSENESICRCKMQSSGKWHLKIFWHNVPSAVLVVRQIMTMKSHADLLTSAQNLCRHFLASASTNSS